MDKSLPLYCRFDANCMTRSLLLQANRAVVSPSSIPLSLAVDFFTANPIAYVSNVFATLHYESVSLRLSELGLIISDVRL
jgi:hypothetical protein